MAVFGLLGIGALVGLTYLILTVGWRGRDFPPGKLEDPVYSRDKKINEMQDHRLSHS